MTPRPRRGAGDHVGRPRLPALDGLRGAAALLVAAYHAWLLSGQSELGGGPWRDALSSGHLAVTGFFVLSGCVLFWPAALRDGDLGPLRAYGLRRAARILPAYYVVLALGVVLASHCEPARANAAKSMSTSAAGMR